METAGVTLTFFGKKRILLAADKIKLFSVASWVHRGARICTLAISSYSQEELTRLHEERLRRNVFSRGELPFIKRTVGWELQFAREYLLRRARWSDCFSRKQDILWICWDTEIMALLRQHYPQVPWLMAVNTDEKAQRDWKDEDPLLFPRGRREEKTQAMLAVMFVVMLAAFLLLVVAAPDSLTAFLVAFSVLLLLTGLLFWLCRREWDTVRLSPEGIYITDWRKKAAMVPAEEIRTVICGKEYGITGSAYLAITDLTPEELTALELERMSRTKKGRLQRDAFSQLPDWKTRFAARYCNRTVENWGWNARHLVVMLHNAEREKTLRELYPNAQWLNAAVDEIVM